MAAPPARPLLLTGVLLLALTGTGNAWAAPEGRWLATADGGGGLLRVGQRWRPGGMLGLEGQYGLTDTWSLRTGLHGGLYPVDTDRQSPGDKGGLVRAGTGTVGVVYSLDVLQVVPFAELSAALLWLGGPLPASDGGGFLGLQLGAGASYLLDRRWAVGAVLRYQHFGIPLPDGPRLSAAPRLLILLLRLERYF